MDGRKITCVNQRKLQRRHKSNVKESYYLENMVIVYEVRHKDNVKCSIVREDKWRFFSEMRNL